MKLGYWLVPWAAVLGLNACSIDLKGDDCIDDDDCWEEPRSGEGTAGNAWTPTTGGWGGGGTGGWGAVGGGGTGGTGSAFCATTADCGSGRVCDVQGVCQAIVAECPLTDECLADPPGYEPPPAWQGIDPSFAGTLGGADAAGRMTLVIDFYDDHFYGEAAFEDPRGYGGVINAIVTGTRSGSVLWGQIVPAQGGRTFDATFDAKLLSGSEITGTVDWWDAEVEERFDLRLVRTSPCGCSTSECTTNSDCSLGERCTDGECVAPPSCETSFDCTFDSICVNGTCKPSECRSSKDCLEGERCLAGSCETACAATCECPSGTQCTTDGVCRPRVDPTKPCQNDCDCDLDAGERCAEDGFCKLK